MQSQNTCLPLQRSAGSSVFSHIKPSWWFLVAALVTPTGLCSVRVKTCRRLFEPLHAQHPPVEAPHCQGKRSSWWLNVYRRKLMDVCTLPWRAVGVALQVSAVCVGIWPLQMGGKMPKRKPIKINHQTPLELQLQMTIKILSNPINIQYMWSLIGALQYSENLHFHRISSFSHQVMKSFLHHHKKQSLSCRDEKEKKTILLWSKHKHNRLLHPVCVMLLWDKNNKRDTSAQPLIAYDHRFGIQWLANTEPGVWINS